METLVHVKRDIYIYIYTQDIFLFRNLVHESIARTDLLENYFSCTQRKKQQVEELVLDE